MLIEDDDDDGDYYYDVDDEYILIPRYKLLFWRLSLKLLNILSLSQINDCITQLLHPVFT